MPKKIDPSVKERAVRLVREHQSEYPNRFAAVKAVAQQVGVSQESVRRWVAQAEIDSGQRPGASSEELSEIKRARSNGRGSVLTDRSVTCFRAGREPGHQGRLGIEFLELSLAD